MSRRYDPVAISGKKTIIDTLDLEVLNALSKGDQINYMTLHSRLPYVAYTTLVNRCRKLISNGLVDLDYRGKYAFISLTEQGMAAYTTYKELLEDR